MILTPTLVYTNAANSWLLTIFCFITVDLVEVCHPNNCNVGLLAYSPLAGGVLTGKYLDANADISKSRLNLFPGYMARYNDSLAKVRYIYSNKFVFALTLELACSYASCFTLV
jgi:hypothetical protein